MVKVAYFGKHISNKIREVNRIFSEILISPFIVRNERKIRYETYDEGDYLDFIKTYNTIYRNAFTVTNVYGHVILDKSINYGKQ